MWRGSGPARGQGGPLRKCLSPQDPNRGFLGREGSFHKGAGGSARVLGAFILVRELFLGKRGRAGHRAGGHLMGQFKGTVMIQGCMEKWLLQEQPEEARKASWRRHLTGKRPGRQKPHASSRSSKATALSARERRQARAGRARSSVCPGGPRGPAAPSRASRSPSSGPCPQWAPAAQRRASAHAVGHLCGEGPACPPLEQGRAWLWGGWGEGRGPRVPGCPAHGSRPRSLCPGPG